MNTIRQITAEETYIVRQEVLRKGQPPESCRFDGDELPTTVHLGLFDNGMLAGIVTVLDHGNPVFGTGKAFQLRGMAVRTTHQMKGFGAALLSGAEAFVKTEGGTVVWFNARTTAVGFYEKAGYQKNGPAFEIGNVGPHYMMFKAIL
ncbi:GNAT family N-acetyltransferase [Flavobacterium magnum]|uniref:GNAT family N-acetyltransferase n=1 Tax=Flavobacterium magnum TaxID=2162713 RepID=A0A2S0RA17_9FLAO|nr:GNAT family N-acetyltransferase [Flavobacterium magnum]AWA28867.1 GNAT family N-acetyltransferase [Flavobacterium magnum]